MGFIVQQLRYIIFFVFIVLRFPKPMSCQMQKRITSKTAADFSLRASGHWCSHGRSCFLFFISVGMTMQNFYPLFAVLDTEDESADFGKISLSLSL